MEEKEYGPTLPVSREIHALKYRGKGEGFKEAATRVAEALKDDHEHFLNFREVLLNQRFLPAGRVQSSMGSPRSTTPYNCFVSGTIDDSMDDIMGKAKEAAKTMQLGGGIGYDFSTLRPRGALIKSLDSRSSGPLSFMGIFDAVCRTISSAGHRRGAQMGVLRVDHPDIEEFIRSKQNHDSLTNFNISVGVTDEFMKAVEEGTMFDLKFEGRVYSSIDAKALWDEILRSTWDWAEPGVLFIDRMNRKNNLHYCETIAATNPCAEQPLPPYGSCLLGSFNLTKYVKENLDLQTGYYRYFDFDQLKHDIPLVVRAMDNVVDRAVYPLLEQEQEAKNKRRMGLGVTGVANAIEAMGYPYASDEFLLVLGNIMKCIRDTAYRASISLAVEKGRFPALKQEFLESEFALTLPEDIREDISRFGLRNSHLLSIAPTGTISLSADNVSSGIEPVFAHEYTRKITTFDSVKEEVVQDYGYRVFGVKGRTANELSPFDHVRVLNLASLYVDSACSKTVNVGSNVSWEEFKDVYLQAYKGGSSGCTTFRQDGKRYGVLTANASEDVVEPEEELQEEEQMDLFGEGEACYINLETGQKECG